MREFFDVKGIVDRLKEIISSLHTMEYHPDKWEFIMMDVDTPVIVPARAEKILVDEFERGRILSTGVKVSDPDAIFRITIDDNEVKISPRKALDYGSVGYNPGAPWLARYDDTENVYVLAYTPAVPTPYMRRVKVSVQNVADIDMSMTYFVIRYKYKG